MAMDSTPPSLRSSHRSLPPLTSLLHSQRLEEKRRWTDSSDISVWDFRYELIMVPIVVVRLGKFILTDGWKSTDCLSKSTWWGDGEEVSGKGGKRREII